MVRITKIYTKSGDGGETHLVGGGTAPKDDLRFDAVGDVDELNAFIGRALTTALEQNVAAISEKLQLIQNELFDLGAVLASPADCAEAKQAIQGERVECLENWIDEFVDGLPDLESFVLPGGTQLNAQLHVARTVCRRAERSIIRFGREENLQKVVQQYINRLSDLLFAMARFESHRSGTPEFLWKPGGE